METWPGQEKADHCQKQKTGLDGPMVWSSLAGPVFLWMCMLGQIPALAAGYGGGRRLGRSKYGHCPPN